MAITKIKYKSTMVALSHVSTDIFAIMKTNVNERERVQIQLRINTIYGANKNKIQIYNDGTVKCKHGHFCYRKNERERT